MRTIQEYAESSIREKKKFLSNVLGHNVDEILDVPSGYKSRNEYITRFRHETYAYSTAHIFQTENGLRVALDNFQTKQLEYLN